MFSRWGLVMPAVALVAIAAAVPGTWESFRSERGLMSVQFPLPPEEKVSFVEGKDYRLERTSYSAEWGRAAYQASSVLMPDTVRAGRKPDEILRAAALSAKRKDWKLYDEVWISSENGSALRFVAAPPGGVESHHYLYLTPTRMYSLVVVVPPGDAKASEVDRFFASFRPLEAPVDIPPPNGGA